MINAAVNCILLPTHTTHCHQTELNAYTAYLTMQMTIAWSATVTPCRHGDSARRTSGSSICSATRDGMQSGHHMGDSLLLDHNQCRDHLQVRGCDVQVGLANHEEVERVRSQNVPTVTILATTTCTSDIDRDTKAEVTSDIATKKQSNTKLPDVLTVYVRRSVLIAVTLSQVRWVSCNFHTSSVITTPPDR